VQVVPLAGPDAANGVTLADPRGLAIGADGVIYVVESGTQQVARFDATGRLLGRWGGPGEGDGKFGEPVALAIDPTGAIHVLDAERGDVQIFGPDGQFRGRYGGDLALYRPRGLALGDDGLIYVADTGGNRVLRLDPSGELRDIVPPPPPRRPPLVEQPTAAVGSDGTIYVAEPVQQRLSRLGADGQATASPWPLAPTDTLHGPRLALGPAGMLIVTDVGNQKVLLVCAGDDRVLSWSLAEAKVDEPFAAAAAPDGTLYVTDKRGQLLAARLSETC
jgi:DNA-binding beta-propeller fold protein YncE